ncbi:MAG: LPXTG cell wall anchor domain-containing protein, partial [Oscillospiraceae bacterium]|nr:LPXTG cell wall anchor domain-containing protein [Oscillospiraceae bacterium]
QSWNTALLEEIGYYVTADDRYSARWTFSDAEKLGKEGVSAGELYRFDGGKTLALPVYASNKSTFQLLPGDQANSYQSPIDLGQKFTNLGALSTWEKASGDGAYHRNPDKESTAQYAVSKEVSIEKKEAALGIAASAQTAFNHASVMEYYARAENTGNVGFGTLPVTDTLTGSQALLAPVAENRGNSGLSGCDKVTVNGTEYYVLTEGTYQNVYLGTIRSNGSAEGTLCLADEIAVTKTLTDITSGTIEYMEGLTGQKIRYTSQVSWYLDALPAGQSRTIVYDTIGVEVTSTGKALRNYSYDNTVYLNGLLGTEGNDRLYAKISDPSHGHGSSYGIDKSIVETLGRLYSLDDKTRNDHTDEVLDADDYSRITARDNSVLYKIVLSYDPPEEGMSITFQGDEIYDCLPKTYGQFTWGKGTKAQVGTKGNVYVETRREGEVTTSAGFDEAWSVSARKPGDTVDSPENQFLRWDSDATITLKGKSSLVLYVTLTFADSATWEAYCKAAAGRELINTVYVCEKPASVTHDLVYENQAYLQKGVNYVYDLADTGSRTYFANGDYAYVEYYTVIYNGGYSKLYLADLVDELPQGFTFHSVNAGANAYAATNGARSTTATTYSGTGSGAPAVIQDSGMTGGKVTYKAAYVTADESADGRVTFHLQGNRSNASFVSYDPVVAEERGEENAWYLSRGEAIAFTYTLKVDRDSSKTGSVAHNRIHMSFNDPFGAGISRYEFPDGEGNGVAGVTRSGIEGNDGACYDYDGKRGLMSWVDLECGEIIPGVVKSVLSYSTATTTEPISSGGTVSGGVSALNWQVEAKNQGSQEITGYTVSDTMELPFHPFGKVGYAIYDSRHVLRTAVYSNPSTPASALFDITHVSDTEVTLLDLTGTEHKAQYGGGPVQITLHYVQYSYGSGGTTQIENQVVEVSFEKHYDDATNTSGTVTMNLYFPPWSVVGGEEMPSVMGIVPTGEGVLTVSTRAIGGTANREYVNRGSLIPNAAFQKAGDGRNLGTMVRDSASVVINGSGKTSAMKQVVEHQGHTDNTATSDPGPAERDSITLHDPSNDFTYTLQVKNTTGSAMERLVITDNLPEVGDHYTIQSGVGRLSAFRVLFAEDPEVTVLVNGTKITGYTVQYSPKTTFQEGDLSGVESALWGDSASDARSIRVVINQSIANDAVVQVVFRARVDGTRTETTALASDKSTVQLLTTSDIERMQGLQANNTFSYWYRTSAVELSAGTDMVGVKLPYFPKLTKQVRNMAGEPDTGTDAVFHFVIYPGTKQSAIPDAAKAFDGLDAGEMKLVTADEATYLLVSVAANQPSPFLYGYEFWKDGTTYTIEEILPAGSSRYQPLTWSARNAEGAELGSGYATFTYQSDQVQEFTAQNQDLEWEFAITKVSEADQSVKLPGAWFALYSLEKPSEIWFGDTKATAADDGQTYAAKVGSAALSAPATYVDVNSRTWYLIGARATDDGGVAVFTGLTEPLYRYLEIKAPDGYNLPSAGYETVSAISEGTVNTRAQVTITNEPGYELPASGGVGTTALYAIGGLLTAGAGAALLLRRRKRA